jgi:hypothetical protein
MCGIITVYGIYVSFCSCLPSDRMVDNPRSWAILLSRLRKRGAAPGGGMEYTHIADQLLGAGTALAGLILIFLSNAVTTYEAYSVSRRREL